MDKDTKDRLEQQMSLGNLGQQVLNNAVYKQAFSVRKAEIFDVFVNTKHEQEDVRQEAWRTMQNLIALEQYFEDVLTSGNMASDTLKLYADKE